MATGFDTKREVTASAEQYAAWAYYGLPATIVTQTGKAKKSVACAVGEVRYVVGWMADQMSRMDWEIKIDDATEWSLEVPGGDTIVSNPEADSDDPEHPRNASAALLKRVGWNSSVVRQVTTNLFVAGECDYCVKEDDDKGDQWTVVSVIHPNRAQLLADAQLALARAVGWMVSHDLYSKRRRSGGRECRPAGPGKELPSGLKAGGAGAGGAGR